MTIAIRQLKDVCEITMGQAPDGDSYNNAGQGIPLIAGAGDFGEDYPVVKKFTSAPTKICADGDIIVSIRATIGTKILSNGAFCLGRGVAGLRPTRELDSRYLWHWLSFAEPTLAQKGRGATFPQVSRSDIGELEISLPLLDEQRRIAAILDKADALRRKRKRAIELLKSHSHAVFAHFFPANEHNSNVVEVGDITTCIVPGRDKPRSFTGSIPWVTTSELAHLGYTTRDRATAGLTEGEVAEVKAKIVPANSVLMTCVGDLGVVSIAQHPMVINQQLHSFQCSERVTPEYLMYALSYQKGFMYRRATQTTLPYMNKTVCNSVPIQLPCLETQIQFSRCIRQVTNRLSAMLLAERAKEKLFSSLQHRAFSGQL